MFTPASAALGLGLILAASTALAGPFDITQTASSMNNTIIRDQRGGGNAVDGSIDGNSNTLNIYQDSPAVGSGPDGVPVAGDGNTATKIGITGNNNLNNIQQTGQKNSTTGYQNGNGNAVAQAQSGYGNTTNYKQYGDTNNMNLNTQGGNNVVVINQGDIANPHADAGARASGNTATMITSGESNRSSMTQWGNNNTSEQTVEGVGNIVHTGIQHIHTYSENSTLPSPDNVGSNETHNRVWGTYNYSLIESYGGNYSNVKIGGQRNDQTIYQDNQQAASLSNNVYGHSAQVTMYGDNNNAYTKQTGLSNDSWISAVGSNGNKMKTEQYGAANVSKTIITSTGGANTVATLQNGSNNKAVSNVSGTGINVTFQQDKLVQTNAPMGKNVYGGYNNNQTLNASGQGHQIAIKGLGSQNIDTVTVYGNNNTVRLTKQQPLEMQGSTGLTVVGGDRNTLDAASWGANNQQIGLYGSDNYAQMAQSSFKGGWSTRNDGLIGVFGGATASSARLVQTGDLNSAGIYVNNGARNAVYVQQAGMNPVGATYYDVAGVSNGINVTVDGSDNAVTAYQLGYNNTGNVKVTGSSNEVVLQSRNPNYAAGGTATIAVSGIDNRAELYQYGTQKSTIVQSGNSNVASLIQEPISLASTTLNEGGIYQYGSANAASLKQQGISNSAYILEQGNNNNVSILQQGNANVAAVEMLRSGGSYAINQVGNNMWTRIRFNANGTSSTF